METNNTTSEAAKSAYFVYAGRTENKQHLYYVLNDLADNDGKTVARLELDTFYTDKKIFKNNRIGYILPVTLKNQGRSVSYNKSASVAGYWKTEQDLVQWRLTDAVGEAVAGIEKLGNDNQLAEALEPVRRIYARSLSRQHRNAVIAEVIRIITS